MFSAQALLRRSLVRATSRPNVPIVSHIRSSTFSQNSHLTYRISSFNSSSQHPRLISTTSSLHFNSSARWRADPPKGPQKPNSSSTPESASNEAQSPAENEAPSEPSKPLPDLRQGIPSTFAEEYLKQASEKESASEKGEPDITAHEAEAESARTGGSGSGRAPPKSAYETSIDKRRAAFARYMYSIFGAVIVLSTVYYGRNWDTEEEEQAHPDAPSGWEPMAMYKRLRARQNEWLGYYTEPTFTKLLPDRDPTLPSYTLVLSLEDMLVHSEWTREYGWRTAKRPGLDFFLLYLSQYFEMTIFTSAPSATADPIYRKLDPYHVITWQLYREATRYENGDYVKDLSYLDRPLEKVILVDTKPSHAKAQPENAIIVPPWTGDPNDRELLKLIPVLEYLAVFGIEDVRTALKSFEGKNITEEFAQREARWRAAHEAKLAAEAAKTGGKEKKKSSSLGRLAGSLSGRVGPQPAQMGAELPEGKLYIDLVREEGLKNYRRMETEIRANGAKWLADEAEMFKKMEQEQISEMRKGFFSWMPGLGGAASSAASTVADLGKKDGGDGSSSAATSS